LRRLGAQGLMKREDALSLREAYLFYRTLESFLRLRAEPVLKREESSLQNAAEFMGIESGEDLVTEIEQKRKEVTIIQQRYLVL